MFNVNTIMPAFMVFGCFEHVMKMAAIFRYFSELSYQLLLYTAAEILSLFLHEEKRIVFGWDSIQNATTYVESDFICVPIIHCQYCNHWQYIANMYDQFHADRGLLNKFFKINNWRSKKKCPTWDAWNRSAQRRIE